MHLSKKNKHSYQKEWNGKLKASIELMIAAIARSRHTLYEGSEEPSDIVKAPEIKKKHASTSRGSHLY
jgi:hypothetical protein